MSEQLIDAFVATIKEKQHLLLLLPKEEWIVEIKIAKTPWNLSFSRNKVMLTAKKNHKDSILHCSLQDWEYMMSGEQKLRQVLKMGNTSYEGTFRSLLLLESIFFLLCPGKAVHKV